MTNANVAMTTASNLRAELARQGRKKGDLARHLGLSGSAMTRRLTGETAMDVNELCAVAAWLDIPFTALLPEPPNGDTSRHSFGATSALTLAA